jgi:type II secretory pathway pseudopilin PulG
MRRRRGFSVIEIILSLAMISVFAIVFVQLFLKAQNLNERAHNLDLCVTVAVGIAERLENDGGLTDLLTYDDLSKGTVNQENDHAVFKIAYDNDWQTVAYNSDAAVYQLNLTEGVVNKRLRSYKIDIFDGELLLYELDFEH